MGLTFWQALGCVVIAAFAGLFVFAIYLVFKSGMAGRRD